MRAAEFFAGIGIVRLALEREGWEIVFANDIDPKKYAMYKEKFGGGHFRLGDVGNIRGSEIPSIDLATASFPCIDLSLAGNRAGLAGSHSSAFWQFQRVLREMRDRKPRFVLLENVLGLLSSHGGNDLKSIVESLNDLGYFCDLLTVDASWFVPQSRPRLFVIGRQYGYRAGGELQTHSARTDQAVSFVTRHPHLKWDFAELPRLNRKPKNLEDVLERLPVDDPRWWVSARKKHLEKQMSDAHRVRLEFLAKSGTISFATVYKRVRPQGCRAELRFDGIAGCLRTPRGGSSKQFVIEAGKGAWRVRHMTAREYARLQGVPDSFPIRVNDNQALFGFGDAVCIPAVAWAVKHCINPMNDLNDDAQKEFTKSY